ncbi:MAG: gamma-glutamyl-gamma-aminobutyrate hydrolase family protein [Ferruginibacter sp.]
MSEKNKITIGVTYTGSDAKHQNYINWLKAYDDIEIIRLSAEDNNIAALENCDGLVLSGGIDIQPNFYNYPLSDYANAPNTFKPERDVFEMKAYQTAIENNIPVLGICRGFQLINCAESGSLKQDLGIDLNEKHWSKGQSADKLHEVIIEENSLLKNIAGVEEGMVNSAHHQAIEKLGDTLIANCKSGDGTIEGFESKDKSDKPFMLAVQWHPERMNKIDLGDSPLSKNIRDRFLNEIENAKMSES